MKIDYPEIGVCGLSCLLCPFYNSTAPSRCAGCKSESRMRAGCPFITCAVKKRGIEFCRQCPDSATCAKWRRHREAGKARDSFVTYQRLEGNIAFMEREGVQAFAADQRERARLLSVMLAEFNEGRSKTLFCIAATVMETGEIADAIARARDASAGGDIKSRSKALRAVLDDIARRKGYVLRLRKGESQGKEG